MLAGSILITIILIELSCRLPAVYILSIYTNLILENRNCNTPLPIVVILLLISN